MDKFDLKFAEVLRAVRNLSNPLFEIEAWSQPTYGWINVKISWDISESKADGLEKLLEKIDSAAKYLKFLSAVFNERAESGQKIKTLKLEADLSSDWTDFAGDAWREIKACNP